MIIKLVTIFSLVVLVLELLIVLANIIFKERPERIAFLRSFKKGKCAIIYVTAIPLYCIGNMYAGQNFLNAFFSAINKIVALVVLKYDTGSIQALMNHDSLYNFTIYFCFVLVGLNALVFTLSLISQYIWSAFQAFKAKTMKRDKLFIFGNNPQNISIYRSDKERNKVIIDDISNKDSEKLYMQRISYIATHSFKEPIEKLFRLIKKFNKEYIVVINTGDDEKNISICRDIISNIENISTDEEKNRLSKIVNSVLRILQLKKGDSEANSEEIKKRLFKNTKIFVFGDPKFEAIYEDIVSSGYGCIHYINKYQKIAMDFIDKYPLSKFLDETQVDYENSLIKEGIDLNVLFIGFGKTAQQLFLTSVANNQFLSKGSEDPELKQVKYFIFDKNKAENNKNLNHNYYRYKHECSKLNPEDYLPLPALPAEEAYYHLDVNDGDFYKKIRSIVTRNPNDANFIVIAFGSDLENMDMAQKLLEKRNEWGLDNLIIFVKVRGLRKEETMIEDEGCYFIGNEKDVVYNIDKIIGDKIFRMAQMRNEVYDLEYYIAHNPEIEVDDECVKKNRENAERNWYMEKSSMERESSLYCCLSLRSKLNLMGLDYCEKEDSNGPEVSEEEYLVIYAGTDKPDTSKYNVTANGKPIVNYTLDFPVSRRRSMAIHEHLRWNSFMISKGMVPSSLEQIKKETITKKDGKPKFTNGKNYAVRRHGNLTTFDGLVEFRKIVAARDGCSEAEKDVIKYDYQLLDDAYWLLQANGYKIVKNVKLK